MFQQQQSNTNEFLEELKRRKMMEKYFQRKKTQQQPNAIDNINSGVKTGSSFIQGIDNMKNSKIVNNIVDKTKSFFKPSDVSNVASVADDFGSGIASSTLTSALPQGADALSFAGQAGDVAGKAGMLSKAGGALGKAAPVLGGLSNGYEAFNNFKNGDYINGTADTAQAVLSFVPGIGTIASTGIEAVQQIFNAQEKAKQKANAKSMAEAQRAQEASEQAVANGEAEIAQQRQENMQNMQEALANQNATSMEGQITGGASGIEQPVLQAGVNQASNNTQGTIADIMNRVKHGYNENVTQKFNPANLNNANYERENMVKENLVNQLASNNITDEATVNDALQGLNNGSSIVDEIISKAGIIKPQSQNEIQLAREGVFNQYKPEVVDKNGWDRFGEAIGTGQRFLANPLVQGGLASLIYKATGGDVGESIQYGIDWMRNKATSDYYGNKINPNGKPQIFGQNYTANDYNNLLSEQKNQSDIALAQIENIMKQQKQDHDIKMATNKDAREAEKLKYDKAKANADVNRSNAMAKYYEKGGSNNDKLKILAKNIENKKNNELDAINNSSNFGYVETGEFDKKGKPKKRPKTKEEAIEEINNKYDMQLNQLLYGKEEDPLGVL